MSRFAEVLPNNPGAIQKQFHIRKKQRRGKKVRNNWKRMKNANGYLLYT